MCFPRARWLAGLYSYKDLFTRGFTGEDTQDMMVGIKKKKIKAAHETKKKRRCSKMQKSPNLMFFRILISNC